MKQYVKRGLAVMLMLVMLIGAMSISTFAAGKPVTKTVKKQTHTSTTKVLNKKATTVKKGTTKLNVKKGEGYAKFKAPKTATYKFTFSNCKSKKNCNNGYVSFQTPYKRDSSYSFFTDVKTKGGKDSTLWLSVNGRKFTGSWYKTIDRPIAKRTGSIKLKKGQVVYLRIYFGGYPTTTNLVIKAAKK